MKLSERVGTLAGSGIDRRQTSAGHDPVEQMRLVALPIRDLAAAAALACLAVAHPQAPGHAQGAAVPGTRPELRETPAAGAWSAEVKRVAPRADRARVSAIRLSGGPDRTEVRIEVNRAIVSSMFTLDDPYRAIIDAANLDFQLPAGSGMMGLGLVTAYRYGQFDAGRSRVVIDLAGPATIESAVFTAPAGRQPGVLSFQLVRVAPADFRALRGPADAADATAAPSTVPKGLRDGRHDDPVRGPSPKGATRSRPVIMLDPGHGGIDPGTVAATGVTEKSVTLAVALHVRNILVQSRRYDVQLTRQEDVFVSLDQRVRMSRHRGADLFVSIHADALAEPEQAQSVKGATVYVLADRASDDRAGRLAEKENAADLLAGLSAVPASAEDQVRSILLDLVERETANYAVSFRSLLVGNMKGKIPLAKDPMRAAAFKVLKQPEVPAVLIELGYMSNADDMSRLGKAEGQRQLAVSIAAAIETFFAKRDAALKR